MRIPTSGRSRRKPLPAARVIAELERLLARGTGPVQVLLPLEELHPDTGRSFTAIVVRHADWARATTWVRLDDDATIRVQPPERWLRSGGANPRDVRGYRAELKAFEARLEESAQPPADDASSAGR